jgi:hydroxyacylglutathione hydrolase
MSLEDGFSDVIAKAMRGLGLETEQLSVMCGVEQGAIENLLRGVMDETAARAISSALGLDADALISLSGYIPRSMEIPGIRRIELPFGHWTVNAWEIEYEGVRILFDTGFGETDLLRKFSSNGLAAAFITHPHPDHIGGVDALAHMGVRVISETEALAAGSFVFGSLRLEVLDLSGHCSPAVGYLIHGMESLVLVAGDALFAGSMGGCKTRESHELAGHTLRATFAKADSSCVILPGHGPATTLAEERLSNPFHPRFD